MLELGEDDEDITGGRMLELDEDDEGLGTGISLGFGAGGGMSFLHASVTQLAKRAWSKIV
jgi:hypothetical protein